MISRAKCDHCGRNIKKIPPGSLSNVAGTWVHSYTGKVSCTRYPDKQALPRMSLGRRKRETS